MYFLAPDVPIRRDEPRMIKEQLFILIFRAPEDKQ